MMGWRSGLQISERFKIDMQRAKAERGQIVARAQKLLTKTKGRHALNGSFSIVRKTDSLKNEADQISSTFQKKSNMRIIHLIFGVTMIATLEAKCYENHFPCGESGLCLPNQWMCDGQPDCSDGSDEAPENCIPTTPLPPPPCKGFRCSSVDRCIPHAWLGDRSKDCIGGEDEGNIGHIHLASKNEFNYFFRPSAPELAL